MEVKVVICLEAHYSLFGMHCVHAVVNLHVTGLHTLSWDD